VYAQYVCTQYAYAWSSTLFAYGVEGGLAHNVEGICHMMGMGLAGHKELRCKLPTRAE